MRTCGFFRDEHQVPFMPLSIDGRLRALAGSSKTPKTNPHQDTVKEILENVSALFCRGDESADYEIGRIWTDSLTLGEPSEMGDEGLVSLSGRRRLFQHHAV